MNLILCRSTKFDMVIISVVSQLLRVGFLIASKWKIPTFERVLTAFSQSALFRLGGQSLITCGATSAPFSNSSHTKEVMNSELKTQDSKLILSTVGHPYLFHLLVSWLTSSSLAVASPAVQKTVYVLNLPRRQNFIKFLGLAAACGG